MLYNEKRIFIYKRRQIRSMGHETQHLVSTYEGVSETRLLFRTSSRSTEC